jgi:hypothetical protein
MAVDPQVVAELRSMFRKGTAPSELIRYIVSRHRTDPSLLFLLQDYFRAAFAVPLMRISTIPEDHTVNDSRYAYLNIDLVHEMIQHRSDWDSMPHSNVGEEQCWLDSLVATDVAELTKRAQPGTSPELKTCWQDLDPKAQKYIKCIMGSADWLYEKVQILGRLVEVLQQQVTDLRK